MFAFTFESIATAYVVMVGASLLLHGFGSCWILMAFVDDIKADMSALDAYKRNKTFAAKHYEDLCKFIGFHSQIRQLGQCISMAFPSH